jgi:S-layer domain
MLSKRNTYLIRFMIWAIIAAIIISVFPTKAVVHASTPRVILSDYSFSRDAIYAGDTFTLRFTLKNTAEYIDVRNLKCTITSEAGEIIPVNSAGTGYIDEIEAEESAELSFELQALKNLEEKSYKLTIKTEYEDWNGSYDVQDIIYVPIRLDTDIVVSDIYIADENIHLGDNIEILATVNNTGAGKVYKVMAKVDGDNIDTGIGYVGNLDSGKNGNVDIIVKTRALKDAGMTNNLIITYENLDGEEFTKKISLGQIDVQKQVYADLIEVKEDTSKPFFTDEVKLGIVVGGIAAFIIILIVRRRLKLKKLEKEFD